jgi:hypothetical protein
MLMKTAIRLEFTREKIALRNAVPARNALMPNRCSTFRVQMQLEKRIGLKALIKPLMRGR